MKQEYIDTVRLLIDIAPTIFKSPQFAMKGGTALNPPAAQDMFTSGVTMPLLAVAEIYGSKLVAAMDGQHPRDIFDVMKMNERFGLDKAFVDCFVAYLAGHNRPVHEVLFSADAPFDAIYESHFRGMTTDDVSLGQLLKVRADLKSDLPRV